MPKRFGLFPNSILFIALSIVLSACSQGSTTPAKTAPVLNRVQATLVQTSTEGKTYPISAFYTDADGDAITLDLEIIRSSREGLSINDTNIQKGDFQKTETEQSAGTWRCGLSQSYDLEISVTIIDEQDLKSESKTLELDCSL